MKKQTKTTPAADVQASEITVAVGIDWADRQHAFHLIDDQGNELADDFEQSPEAINDWLAMLRKKFPTALFNVCVEQSKGALISPC